MKKNVKKKNLLSKMDKKINVFFISVFFLILIGGFIRCILLPTDINYYENRTANKIQEFTINSFKKGEFQDSMELAFSDQIPKSSVMKKFYNYSDNLFIYYLSKFIYRNDCENKYVPVNDKINKFGCGNNLVFSYNLLKSSKKNLNSKIENINKFKENNDVDLYLYYIEKDTDINFENNNKVGFYDYIKSGLNIDDNHISRFKIDNFQEFNKYFYKTDHHWNYKGSYLAYTDIVNMMTNDDPIKNGNKQCLNYKISGSKAVMGAVTNLYKEDFCFYNFSIPEHQSLINGKKEEYGFVGEDISSDVSGLSYSSYYGGDNGVVKISYNNNNKNLLIIGESYDNAITKILSTHFNDTYNVDLRNYERENSEKFNIEKFIEDNNIDDVLLIGNVDYFTMKEFNLE